MNKNSAIIVNKLKKILKKIIVLKNPWCIPLSDQVERISSPDPNYFAWLVKNKLTDNFFQLMSPLIVNTKKNRKILFSIVMPVYNTEPLILEKAVLSVVRQTYPRWELLICDDASNSATTLRLLDKLRIMDSRIKIFYNKKNCGISDSTNICVEKSHGNFVLFLDHDDELYSDALLKTKNFIDKNPDKNIFYSDEDRISPQGYKYRYNFKPDFSPSLLETHNYILHLFCIKKDLFLKAGGLNKKFDGSQDYDLLLRLMDMEEKFVHIPDILYSWRESETSMIGGAYKPEIFISGKKALVEHYKRTYQAVNYIENNHDEITGVYRTRFTIPETLKILLIKSDEKELHFDCYDLPGKMYVEVMNLQELNGVKGLFHLRQEYDLFLFLDTQVVPYLWQEFLMELAGHALRKNSGIIGAYVLSDDLRVICAGMSLMPNGKLRHDYRGMHKHNAGISIRVCDRLAVSSTAMAVSSTALKKIFYDFKFSSDELDIALCLNAHNAGLRNIFNPHAQAAIKSCFMDSHYKEEFFKKIPRQFSINKDPFLNPNLYPSSEKEMGYILNITGFNSDYTSEKNSDEWSKFYAKWLKKHSPDIATSEERIKKMEIHPFFSVIIPTFNSPLKYFRKLISSLKNQTYDNFEICISDDASTDDNFIEYLKKLSNHNPFIRIILSYENNGIAKNTNKAISMAKGDFIIFCDHDDKIELFALEMMANYINKNPDADVLYSDEDMIDERGIRHSPRPQPDWNPDMLLSHMYCPHLVCFKTSLMKQVGNLNSQMDGAQDYDFFLRITEQALHVGHVQRILYSWRSVPGSVACDASAKIYSYEAGRKAIEDALKRRNIDGKVLKASGTGLNVYRVKRKIKDTRVSHIIQGKSGQILEMIKSIRLVSSISVEIIVVVEEDNIPLMEKLKKIDEVIIKIIPPGAGRSVFYNAGAMTAKTENLIFSGNDIELLDSDYPFALIEHIQRKTIGAAGVKLIYPNGLYYHTGMILGVNGVAGYAHRNLPQSPGYWNFAACIRNYSAVSWDFLGITKTKWAEVGGFDTNLNKFGDVDFCVKLLKKGFRNIYTPYITGVIKRKVHSLEELRDSREENIIMKRHGEIVNKDPMYHPLLSRDLENFSLLI